MTLPVPQFPFDCNAPQSAATPDALRNYRRGMNPEYDRWAEKGTQAESKEAQDARLLREAPSMMNAYQPLFRDVVKHLPRPSLWQRLRPLILPALWFAFCVSVGAMFALFF